MEAVVAVVAATVSGLAMTEMNESAIRILECIHRNFCNMIGVCCERNI